jgi:hypothetical protein
MYRRRQHGPRPVELATLTLGEVVRRCHFIHLLRAHSAFASLALLTQLSQLPTNSAEHSRKRRKRKEQIANKIVA